MAQEKLYRRDELLGQLNIDEAELARWEKRGLVPNHLPSGGGGPFYTESHAEAARQVAQLAKLGYALDAIEKIVRKVGLPGEEKAGKMNAEGGWLTVGELASATGLNARTIKYWEERGIISPDARSGGGFRLYREQTVQLCLLIRDLQLFGFTLEEIKEGADLLRDFFALADGTSPLPAEQRATRLDAIEENIAILQRRMSELKEGISRWEGLLKKRGKQIDRMRNELLAELKPKPSGKSKDGAKSKTAASGTVKGKESPKKRKAEAKPAKGKR